MRQLTVSALCVALALVVGAAPAGAHGGIFPPRQPHPPAPTPAPYPGDTVGGGPATGGTGFPMPGSPAAPGSAAPKGPVPAGPSSPPGGAPGVPPAPGPGPASAPSAPGPFAGGPGRPVTPTNLGALVDTGHWSLWWGFNRHPYLDLKRHVTRGAERTGDEDFSLGGGTIQSGARSLRPAAEEIATRVVPALLTALESDTSVDVTSACLVALAKIGAERAAADRSLRDVLAPHLADPNQEIAETAALALGILGDEAAAPLLVDLMRDAPAGRSAVGGGPVPERTRSFAAYGLGLVGSASEREDVRRYAVHHLTEAIAEPGAERRDLEVACVLAIGIIGLEARPDDEGEGQPPTASRAAQVAWLLDVVADDDRDPWTRAHAATSLGRLVGVLPEDLFSDLKARVAARMLHETRTHTKAPDVLQQSSVLALGAIGDGDADPLDDRIRDRLRAVVDGHGNREARSFALMALSLAGVRDGLGEDPAAGLEKVRDFLGRQLAQGRSGRDAWAGLAVGVLVNGRARRGKPDGNAGLVAALRARLLGERSADLAAAYCVGSGLAGDQIAGTEVLVRFSEEGFDWLRGYQALGLGLMGYGPATEPLREVLAESRYHPELLAQTGTALALLDDGQAVPALVEMLRASKSLATQASLATALGLIGDRRSVEPLIAMLTDETLTDGARAFAAAALGGVADRRELPWGAPYATGVNYAAATETLFDAQGKGLLNLL